MASSAVALGLAVVAMIALPLGAVAWRAGGLALAASDLAALRFTLAQAVLSAGLSVAFAVPLARALARRRFPGRALLISLLGAPFLLPVIVAVFGLLAVFGRSGWINAGLRAAGLPEVAIYGLQGVVLAHVFLNLPLATRMILQGWQSIPAERIRVAQSLGFSRNDLFRHLERPMLRQVLPGAMATILAVCLTSFAVALVLGGGPRATTLELAIYQALRFDFDLAHAAGLALVQTAIGAVAALTVWFAAPGIGLGGGLDRDVALPAMQGWQRGSDAGVILLATLFLLTPLGAVVLRGVPGLAALPPEVWAAAIRSLSVALISTGLTMAAALTLAMAVARQGARRGARWLDLAGALPLATSGLVLGTGLFVLTQPFVSPSTLALPATVLVNALLTLPFAYRLLLPQARALEADFGSLAASLGMDGLARLQLLTLPRLARPLGFAAGLAAALSMGDLGVIALFAGERGVTLPLIVQRLMGAYRMEAAAGAALLLVGLGFGLFWLFDAWGRRAAT